MDIYGTEGRISIEIPFNVPPDRPDAGVRDRRWRPAGRARHGDAHLRHGRPVRRARPRRSGPRCSPAVRCPRRPRTPSRTCGSSSACSPRARSEVRRYDPPRRGAPGARRVVDDSKGPSRVTGRTRRLVAGLAIVVVLLAVVGAGLVAVRLLPGSSTPSSALGAPRFVDETGDLRARLHLRRRVRVLHGRRRRRVRLRRGPAARRLPAPAARTPRRCSATRARPAAPCASPGWTRRSSRWTGSSGRIRWTSTATASRTSRSSGSGETVLLRGTGGCRFEPLAASIGPRPADRVDHGLQRHLGGRPRPCRRSPSAAT